MRSLPFDWRIQELEEFMISTGRNTIAAEDQPLASWWNLHDIKPMQLNDITKKWSFITIIRQVCKKNHIPFNSQIKYDKSSYDICYYIYYNDE